MRGEVILPEDTPGLKELLALNAAKMARGEWPDPMPELPSVLDENDPDSVDKFEAALAEIAKYAKANPDTP